MSLPIKVLSVTLAAYFIFIGVSKITPKVNRGIYYNWLKAFKSFTIDTLRGPIKDQTGILIKSKYLRRGVGCAEVITGLFLLPVFPRIISNLSNLILITLMGFTLVMHFSLNKGLEYMAAPLVFILLLIARLIMVYQSKKVVPVYQPRPGMQYDKKEKLSDSESENTEQSELDDSAGDRVKED
ncbi:unnamed protein product [Gordionus sp. m RMFG-2023]|uniref:novel acetylcholine receptor chaperone-like n=1 Tax=Gordionus sp. m RMFG-2023 TaxID=3053472 RepID=UPI0030DFD9EC